MTNQRKCHACGRPLTGRQRKWCKRSDCGGWESVHPPITIECTKCGSNFETYRGSSHSKCPSCRYHPEIRYRACDSDDPRLTKITTSLLQNKLNKEQKEQLIREVTALGWDITVSGNFVSLSKLYNPNFCVTCGLHTSHGQYGDCFKCGKKNPSAETVVYCGTCADYALHRSDGVCNSCGEKNERYPV